MSQNKESQSTTEQKLTAIKFGKSLHYQYGLSWTVVGDTLCLFAEQIEDESDEAANDLWNAAEAAYSSADLFGEKGGE